MPGGRPREVCEASPLCLLARRRKPRGSETEGSVGIPPVHIYFGDRTPAFRHYLPGAGLDCTLAGCEGETDPIGVVDVSEDAGADGAAEADGAGEANGVADPAGAADAPGVAETEANAVAEA